MTQSDRTYENTEVFDNLVVTTGDEMTVVQMLNHETGQVVEQKVVPYRVDEVGAIAIQIMINRNVSAASALANAEEMMMTLRRKGHCIDVPMAHEAAEMVAENMMESSPEIIKPN